MTVSFASGDFDTPLRYVDWVLTVPLMLVEVIAVTSVGAVAAAKFRSWGLAAVVMIGAGYYGEMASAGSDQYWIGFVLSMIAYGYILRELQMKEVALKLLKLHNLKKLSS